MTSECRRIPLTNSATHTGNIVTQSTGAFLWTNKINLNVDKVQKALYKMHGAFHRRV